MTLAEAFHIALNNSDFVRVFAFNAQHLPTGGIGPAPSDIAGTERRSRSAALVIGQLDHDSFAWRFKSQVMAKLRSVERQYWCLAQTQVQRESSEQAVRAGQEILDREKAELVKGRGTDADVAEASQRQEQFNLYLVTRTSDVITTEREFRNVLGLPQADNRRIVPATDPTAELVEFDWETCLDEMMYLQPEIVLHKLSVNELQPAATVPAPAQRQAAGAGRESSKVKDDLRESHRKERQDKLQQLVHERTHALARSFLEVDADYKQYKTGKRLCRCGETATRCPASLLRARPHHDGPVSGRRQPVLHGGGSGISVQDDVQHRAIEPRARTRGRSWPIAISSSSKTSDRWDLDREREERPAIRATLRGRRSRKPCITPGGRAARPSADRQSQAGRSSPTRRQRHWFLSRSPVPRPQRILSATGPALPARRPSRCGTSRSRSAATGQS